MSTLPDLSGDAAPPGGLIKGIVATLTLPTILGVAIFTALALFPSAPPTNWDPNARLGLGASIGLMIVFGAFFGAAYGPLLIPIAAWVVLLARRRGTPRLSLCWVLIVLGLVATAVSYAWALDAVELP